MFSSSILNQTLCVFKAGHPDATDLTRDFSPGNSDAMDILTLGLRRVLGLELERQDVPGLKNTGVNFLASGCCGPLCLTVQRFAPFYLFYASLSSGWALATTVRLLGPVGKHA